MLRWKSSLKPAAAASADIALEASAVTTATSFSTPTNIDVNIPAVSTNNILILFVSTDSPEDPTSSPPSGWTKIAEQDGTNSFDSTVAAYWKRASSGSTATTETWSSFFPTGAKYYIWVGAYSGCVTSGSPVDAYGTAALGYSSSWSVNVTTTVTDTMIVTVSGTTRSTITQTWTDGTELIDTAYQSVAAVSINEKLEATSGAKTRTSTPSSSDPASMIAVALKPAVDDYRSTILADSPVAYYRLGESSGTTASDETGNYDATYANSPTLGEAGAISGDSNTSVLLASASQQYAEIDSSLSITAYPFTIEAWVKTTATADSTVGAFVVSTTNNQMFALRVDASGYAYNYARNTSGVLAESTTAVNDGYWHHIVAVFAASNDRTIYVDGVAEDTHAANVTLPAINRFSIGRMGDSSPGSYFNGTVDEVAVYDTALSASTILAHYNAGTGGGYLIDENFDDNLLPSGWTVTGTYSITGGILEGINGADYVTFDVPSAMQDEFWMYARIDGADGNFSKASYSDMFEVLDSSNAEFIQGQFYGTSAGFYRLDGATTATSQMVSLSGTAYYVWFHFVKNGTSELWISQSSTKPTTDSSTECVISCSTANTSAAKLNLKLGWSNGTRPLKWDFFIGDDAEI